MVRWLTQIGCAWAPLPTAGPGKRERLVAAARQLLYEHGVEKTTLADIAAAADVPVGNVYYYFKTKDAMVVRGHRRLPARHTAAERAAEPAANAAGRLKALSRPGRAA